jgi:hypothetical protein
MSQSEYSDQPLPPMRRVDEHTVEVSIGGAAGPELDPGEFDAVESPAQLIDFMIVRLIHREMYLRFIQHAEPSRFMQNTLLAVQDDLEFAVLGRDKLRGQGKV